MGDQKREKEYHQYCCKMNNYNSVVSKEEREPVLGYEEWVREYQKK